jgi:hypothetical protein
MGGTPNEVLKIFTVPALPAGTSLRVFYNGDLLRPGTDYTVSGTNVILNFAPATGEHVSAILRTTPATLISNYLNVIINFFKAARCLLDSVTSSYPQFFDAVVPTVSGSTLVLPYTPTSLELYRNGIYQTAGVDFTLSGAVVTPTLVPGSDSFIAWGTYAGTGTAPAFYDYKVPAGTIDGTNAVFTLPLTPMPATSLRLYLNGLLMTPGVGKDYTLSGATITYTSPPPVSSAHTAFFRG